MVEGHDEVIYEEITIHSYSHERSCSAPDIPAYKCNFGNTPRTLCGSTLRRRTENKKTLYDQYSDTCLSKTTCNKINAYEINDNQNMCVSSISLNDTSHSGVDASIYVKMNEKDLFNDTHKEISPMIYDFKDLYASVTYNSNVPSLFSSNKEALNEGDTNKENSIDESSHSLHDDHNNILYNNFAQANIKERRINSFPQLAVVQQSSGSLNYDVNQIYDNVSSPTHGLNLFSPLEQEENLQESDQLEFSGIYADIPFIRQRERSNSSTESERNRDCIMSRLSQELRARKDTVYAEILHSNRYIEISNSRITRESDNPILRNGFLEKGLSSIKRASSLIHLEKNQNSEEAIKRLKKVFDTRSQRPQSLHFSTTKSAATLNPPISLQNSVDKQYGKYIPLRPPIPRARNDVDKEINCKLQVETEDKENSTNKQPLANSCYENIEVKTQFYENLSDTDSDTVYRERRHSKPIEIHATQKQQRQPQQEQRQKKTQKHHNIDNMFHYVDTDFPKEIQPFSYSSSSVASSPQGSVCSSMGSDLSTFTPNSISPPPLPSPRKRGERHEIWENIYAFTGLNYISAHYLGQEIAYQATSKFINNSINNIAQRTNVLEMKPVFAEISHDFVRFVSNLSPWEIITSFPIGEIIRYEIVKKNAFFLGIIAGKAGQDAICYVLQSDKALEIGEAIQEVFQSSSKIPRSHTIEFPPSIEPEFHRHYFLVQIGHVKVKKMFHNVNDYVKKSLERINPRTFKNISLEIIGQSIVVTDDLSGIKMSYSTPSILTSAVFLEDRRYFAYIISELEPNGKPLVKCYVFRSARYETTTKIIANISNSYQDSYTPQRTSSCDINPIYSPFKMTYSNVVPRSSTSSMSSYATSSTTSLPSPTASDNFSIRFPSRQNSGIDVSCTYGSTETLQTLIPCSSIDGLTRSSSVASRRVSACVELSKPISDTMMTIHERPLLQRSMSHDIISSFSKTNKDVNLIGEDSVHQDHEDERPQSDTYATVKNGAKKPRHKRFLKKIRNSIKHRHHDTNSVKTNTTKSPVKAVGTPLMEEEFTTVKLDDIKPELYVCSVSYICSTMISPPLKRKHIKDCYKQYNKEIIRAGKCTDSNIVKTVGSPIHLKITTNKGIDMLHPNQMDVIRHFPINTIEMLVRHPVDDKCFGISTSVPGNTKQHKCHLFSIKNDLFVADINVTFDKMIKVKEMLAL